MRWLISLFFVSAIVVGAQEPLVVHEWGTFTALQDEDGRALGGINTDDEPVPDFVHSLHRSLLLGPTQLPPVFFVKGFPRAHPDVTMRLETPVLYFYPGADQELPLEVDVRATFRGGWLSEYYPKARVEAPGLKHERPNGQTVMGGIDGDTQGSLVWEGLRVGVQDQGPVTQEEVWLAPRRVQATQVATPQGESEKYLFYRGVGHLDALLQVQRRGDELIIGAAAELQQPIAQAWLADIRADGRCAFRGLGRLEDRGEGPLTRTAAAFAENEYSPARLAQLRASMHQSLVADGLFEDEAQAMLDTWEAAYFQSPGLRLFFMVPQDWTDRYLPLQFSRPVQVTRVMVGRIELVTPQQRALLARLAGPLPQPFPSQQVRAALSADNPGSWAANPLYEKLMGGEIELQSLGVPLPAAFADFLALGRMRHALVLDELQRRPSPGLRYFADLYRLEEYPVPEEAPAMAEGRGISNE
ncbi:MAG: hypothetical protein GKR89_01165 [Candidatus Latescibacteria bacterium]|nr:hypothetical protein [Candidatus Latescibacterota bacterium]